MKHMVSERWREELARGDGKVDVDDLVEIAYDTSATRVECNACGDTPNLYGIIPKDAVAGDQCPCCFIPDMDCDGILVERPTDD